MVVVQTIFAKLIYLNKHLRQNGVNTIRERVYCFVCAFVRPANFAGERQLTQINVINVCAIQVFGSENVIASLCPTTNGRTHAPHWHSV